MRRLRLPLGQATVGIVLSLVFVSRWVLSGRNSYWLDELVSVVSYGIENKSGAAAIKNLASHSIHPPLYQLILYYWMRLFGDGEVVTRFLSNLYATGAGLCLYLMVKEAVGRRRALMAAIFFSLMYQPFYYAMETRSYAQTLLLTSLSSLALFRFMRVLAAPGTWQQQFRSRACLLLVAANSGLLLTHYYNTFFLGSQGLFLLGWVLLRARGSDQTPAQTAQKLVVAATPLLSPLAFLLILWGPVMVGSYHSFSGHNKISGASAVTSPFKAFVEHSVGPNFLGNEHTIIFSTVLVLLCAALLAVFYAEQAVAVYRESHAPRVVGKRALGFYALVMAFVPFLFSCALFAVSGHERYSDRYFIFTTPPFAIMIVLAVEQAVLLLARVTRGRRTLRGYLAYSALSTLVVTAALILPNTYAAATHDKADWRGIAKVVANITGDDPGHKYVLFETGFGKGRINYYLERAGAKIRARGSVTPPDEKRFARSKLAKQSKDISRYDFLILTFTHLQTDKFPKTIAKLNGTYEVHQRILDDGRGMIIYRIDKKRS